MKYESITQTVYYNDIVIGNTSKRLLIVAQDFSESGAPIALLNFALAVMKCGYAVDVYCQCGGPLVEKYVNEGLIVHVEDLSERAYLYDWIKYKKYSAVIINTLLQYKIVQKLNNTDIKVLWWIHESETYFNAILDIEGMFPVLGENVTPMYVGSRVKKSFDHFVGHNDNARELLYCVDDIENSNHQKPLNDKKVFAFIGALQYRKGVDIFIDAIKLLGQEVRSNSEFWIIGAVRDENTYINEYIKSESKGEIRYWGALPFDEMSKIYDNIDVLVCSSRMDPMPVVVTEAMMNKKVCIVSDAVGNADFIINEESGYIFKSEDTRTLADLINKVFYNWESNERIADNGYKIYEDYFSREVFDNSIKSLLEEKIGD